MDHPYRQALRRLSRIVLALLVAKMVLMFMPESEVELLRRLTNAWA